MSAIFGLVGNCKTKDIEAMGHRLLHRGRFHHHFKVSDNVCFGVRSSYENSHFFSDSHVSVIMVGTIYNAEQIKEQINNSGHELKSGSIAEIVGLLYNDNETRNLYKILGDFSFALWDHKKNCLVLCRDFFGLYPMYYANISEDKLAFSSEYKGLLALDSLRTSLDRNMIQFLQFSKKLPVGKTLFNEIKSILPGSPTVFFSTQKNAVVENSFPKLELKVEERPEEEFKSDLAQFLTRAISDRVGNKKTIGIALSGGIDSIGIACICRNLFPDREIHTFTAGWKNDPDLEGGKLVAEHINAIHHEILTPPSLMESDIHKLVWHVEDPFSRSESLQLYRIAKIARKYVDTIISGQGADSLFLGMPKYKLVYYMKKFPIFFNAFSEFYNFTQYSKEPETTIGKILKSLYFRGSIPDYPIVKKSSQPNPGFTFPPMSHELINDVAIKGFQIGQCQDIQKFERNIAGFGMNYQSPFYDLRLVRKAYTIPDRLKINKGMQKYILRQCLKGNVPDKFLSVPKLPQRMKYDLEFSRCLNRLASDYLSKEKVETRGIFAYGSVDALIKKDISKPYSAEGAMRIWTALLTEIWAIEFLDKRGIGFPDTSPSGKD